MYGTRIIGDEEKLIAQRTKQRLKYHNRLIILHEILNDVLSFKNLKNPDSAIDYKEKLVYINERREMISFLNQKYKGGTKLFLEILDIFKANPHLILVEPNPLIKRLIHETLNTLKKESTTNFDFKNQHLGDMIEMIDHFWDELVHNERVDEVLMKDFLAFALKKHFITDEKELVTLFKDLVGN